ncbi:Phosphate-specific outer membrane porin OprP; Pyrophosphate-specific outer membrane porin OprO [hydrothermal vent metagenome]|uniref:Phosphate-specific outer membrane porin OprP Pyrophosphate-specific outer membrane porin OprO n=1 Tax=hydrothermal vent metagenome TaxID=652676 RepID=A0A1W1C7L2_9ZZZZ
MFETLKIFLLGIWLSSATLYAEHNVEHNATFEHYIDIDNNISITMLDPEQVQWFTIPYSFGYAPLISNDMNVSAYDWNAFDTKWINMRALALLAVDGSHFYQDGVSKLQVGDLSYYDRFDVRGLRLGVGGTINFDQPWTYLFSSAINVVRRDYEWGSGDWYTLFDAVVGVPLWGNYGRLQVGKMKEPISMERAMGLVFEQVMERPMHLDAFLPTRDIGISISDMILDGRARWRAGYFNAWLDKPDLSFSQSNQIGIGRFTVVAYEEGEQLLHLGAGYRYEDVREGTLRYDIAPEQNFIPSWLDTGEFPAENSQTLNLEASWLDGPLWIASEYTAVHVRSKEYDDPDLYGYHLSLNYFITKEHRGYNHRTGTVRRIRPMLDFTEGGLGALELSARYSFLDLNDGALQGGEMSIVSVGFIWHPRYDLQLHAQWSRADLKNPSKILSGKDIGSSSNILQFRFVFMID